MLSSWVPGGRLRVWLWRARVRRVPLLRASGDVPVSAAALAAPTGHTSSRAAAAAAGLVSTAVGAIPCGATALARAFAALSATGIASALAVAG